MISIIYCTNRVDPKFNWFIDSLFNQTTELDRSGLELIFIDYAYSEHANSLKDMINGRFRYIHSRPRPNIYQGDKRKTKGEYFSPCNSRNTGYSLAEEGYVVFIDDVSVLMPGWFDAIKRASDENKIVCGAYQKHFEVVVDNGLIISSVKHDGGIDSRWRIGDAGIRKISGSNFFGCSFGLPSGIFKHIDGFDEICDSIGGEDYHFGIRLNNAGHTIYYDRSMLTIESEELHNQPYLMKREDRTLPEGRYMDRLSEFGVNKRFAPHGNLDSSHLVLDVLMMTDQKKSLGIDINSDHHWFDRKPLIDMQ